MGVVRVGKTKRAAPQRERLMILNSEDALLLFLGGFFLRGFLGSFFSHR